MQSAESVELPELTLTYIVNGIPEPTAPTYRYVSTTATGSDDGTTEALAWTVEQADENASAGMTVWIKAGDYGNRNLYLTNEGTATAPIKFIGYRNSIEDITSNYWDYTTTSEGDWATTWDVNEMPTFTGSSETSGIAVEFESARYLIFRNIQISNYLHGFQSFFDNPHLIFDRINGHSFGGGTDSSAAFVYLASAGETGMDGCRVTNSVGINADKDMFAVLGIGNMLFDNVRSYNDRPASNAGVTDYHIVINGSNSVIRNSSATNYYTEGTTSSHGIGIAGRITLNSSYNLIDSCTAINMSEAIYFRNAGVDHNVAKDCHVGNNQADYSLHQNTGGLTIWGDAKYNVFERCTVERQNKAIFFAEIIGEDFLPVQHMPSHNIVRNCVFDEATHGFQYFFFAGDPELSMDDNTIINNTFNNVVYLIDNGNVNTTNLNFINNNMTNVANYYEEWAGATPIGTAIRFDNNNTFGSFSAPEGNGNIALDPLYSDADAGDFSLRVGSPSFAAGQVSPLVSHNHLNVWRGLVTNDVGAY